MNFRIRPETALDAAAIEAVTVAAFLNAAHADHTEHFVVKALRQSGQLAVSLVAEHDKLIIGHAAVSPVTISSGAEGWYGLGPLSVTPQYQGLGIGTQLMHRTLIELRALGAAGCVVLGDPRYYARFGFRANPLLILPGVPAEYFQAVSFDGSMPTGTVSYHESFAAKA